MYIRLSCKCQCVRASERPNKGTLHPAWVWFSRWPCTHCTCLAELFKRNVDVATSVGKKKISRGAEVEVERAGDLMEAEMQPLAAVCATRIGAIASPHLGGAAVRILTSYLTVHNSSKVNAVQKSI